ncbi:MAG: ABC transporter ATP-binding protein [Candidatus Heimdallarchaeota archaeon]|nr:ABC transporter ATP-binding protein [Candidatus Heimdallarchaeota archaeon]
MISINDLSYIYDIKGVKTHALSNINVEIPLKEFVAIKGKSGMGKSTFLKCIAGLLTPATGNILVDKFELVGASETEISSYLLNTIGLMFQDYNLADFLNVKENIMLPGIIANKADDELEKRADELMQLFGIIQYKNRYPDQLSGGEQQRVALAVALFNDPDIILCDEPTGALDVENSRNIYEYLKKLHDEFNKTIIVVSHDPMIDNYSTYTAELSRDSIFLRESNAKEN